MSTRWRWTVLGSGFALYLLAMGFLAGIVVERIRFDQHRIAVLARYEAAVRQWHVFVMQLEKTAAGTVEATEPRKASASEMSDGIQIHERRREGA